MRNEELINELIRHKQETQNDFGWNTTLQTALEMAIAALKAEPCDRLKFDGMLEDAYEHGYQQARYDYELQPCEDYVSREAVIAVLDWHEHEKSEVESYIREIAEDIKALPPVTPKPKNGKVD